MAEEDRQVPVTSADDRLPVAAIVLVWLAAAFAMAMLYWPRLDESFASADNLMRLVQVRALLDGAPWFDPHEPRLAPPLGYDTHWSRLIDAGIAGLILLFREFASPDLAERLARCCWPLLLSGPTVWAVTGITVRLGGSGAGRIALLAALPTLALLPTFRPGEIDHHNAQVTLSLVLIACTMWADRGYFAAAAGLAGGALLTVGLEAAYVPAVAAAALGLLLVSHTQWARPARDFGAVLAVTTLAGYLLVTPASLRWRPECDAIAINSALAVAVGAAGLALVAGVGQRWTSRARFVAMLVAGVLALATFIAIEPRCLGGPFGLIDRSIFPLWLDHVSEMQPVASRFRTDGLRAAAYVAFPLIATLSLLLLVRRGLRTPLAWTLVAIFTISALIMIGQVRIVIYVTWFGLPFVAVAAQSLAERTKRPVSAQFLAAVLASPPIITLGIAALAHEVAAREQPPNSQDSLGCFLPEPFRVLASLPPGLVLAPLDLAASVLAHTQHRVVAAPYHRVDQAIRFDQEVMNGPSAAARERVTARGVDYIVSCTRFQNEVIPGSFHAVLLAGTAGSWLDPVPGAEAELLKVWSVKR
jgi:hypothetical protein